MAWVTAIDLTNIFVGCFELGSVRWRNKNTCWTFGRDKLIWPRTCWTKRVEWYDPFKVSIYHGGVPHLMDLVGGFNPEKYESQLGWWHSQYSWDNQKFMATSHHQPGMVLIGTIHDNPITKMDDTHGSKLSVPVLKTVIVINGGWKIAMGLS